MKQDITSEFDLEQIIRSFYGEALTDSLLKPVFDKANLDLEQHLPRMISFWNQVVFEKQGYTGSPIPMHIALNKIIGLEKQHFDRWLELFQNTISANFEGKNALKMKERAYSIGVIIQSKIYQDNQDRIH